MFPGSISRSITQLLECQVSCYGLPSHPHCTEPWWFFLQVVALLEDGTMSAHERRAILFLLTCSIPATHDVTLIEEHCASIVVDIVNVQAAPFPKPFSLVWADFSLLNVCKGSLVCSLGRGPATRCFPLEPNPRPVMDKHHTWCVMHKQTIVFNAEEVSVNINVQMLFYV